MSPLTPPTWRRVAWLWGAHLSLSLLAIMVFSLLVMDSAREERLLVAFHLLVATPLWLLVFSAAGLLLASRVAARYRLLRGLALVAASGYAVAGSLLYLIDLIGNRYWGSNVSDQMALEFFRHFPEFRAALMPWWGWALASVLLVGAVAAHGWLFGPGLRAWGEVLRTAARSVRGARPSRRLMAAVSVALIMGGYGAGLSAFWQTRVVPLRLWRSEPLTAFVVISRPHLIPANVRAILFPATPRRAQEAAADARLRRAYGRRTFSARNVIVFLVDCLRADHLSFYGYHRDTTPFLARLREQGRLRQVAEARAACNCTPCGVMSVLASRPQAQLGEGLFMLHDVLHDQGYRTHFILAGWHDVWYDLRALYGRSIDYYYEGTQTKRYLPDDDRLLLEGLEPVPASNGTPAFFYFHLMSAHDTGVYGPEFNRWQPSLGFQLGGTFSVRGNDPVKSGNTYDNKLLKADAIIEELFGALDRKGYLQDAMVVILGDHGQGLGEHGHYGHGRRLYEEDLRVPLLIVDDPAVRYGSLSTAVQADVAPTILDRLSLPVPASWSGRSLLSASAGPGFSAHYGCMGGNQAAVFQEGGHRWKLIRGKADGEELYDLTGDPSEATNLVRSGAATRALVRGRALLQRVE